MNMKSKKIKDEFDALLRFDSHKDEIEHRSKMIMFQFLDLVEKEMFKRNMNKKDLAEKLNTSPSFITQLFTGSKTINLLTLAKLEDIFKIKFQVSLSKQSLKDKNFKAVKRAVRAKKQIST